MLKGKVRLGLYAIILVVLAGLMAASAWAIPAIAAELPEVGSVELIESPDEFNNETVVYSGEVIGEILHRGDYAWITVNDDHYGKKHTREYAELKGGNTGIGVYCRADMLEDVEFLGSYTAAGDIIEVIGTFYKASPDHGGDLMIEAERVSIVKKGHPVKTHRLGKELYLAVALGLASLILGAFLFLRRGSRGRGV